MAVVTGSSRGLGLASATALVTEGCRVVVCARSGERLAAAADSLRQLAGNETRVTAVVADLSTPQGAADVVSRAVEVYGGLDILVNNVGLARGTTIVETSDAEWTEALDQTLFPAIRASRLAVPHMRRRGGGAIIMIASIWGRESGGRMTYNAVKAAEISLAKSMAQQLAKDNIRVNSVAPGIDFVSRWFVVQAASRKIRSGSPNSSSASCRSDDSAAPRKSGRSWPFSPRRAPAGSAAPACPLTAASQGRTSEARGWGLGWGLQPHRRS